MASNKRKTYGGTALLLLAVLFIGLIMLSTYALRGMRLDLTENNQYTLASGTRNILKNIKEPINLYFYFSREAGEQAPMLKLYATRVQELLEEMSARAKGNIHLQVIDPKPFSDEEEEATQRGLTPFPMGGSEGSMFFGLAGSNSTDGKEAIAAFEPNKEAFLEYDIARLILQLSEPKKPTIGLLTSLPMNFDYNPQTGQQREAWVVLSQLQQLFKIETLNPSMDSIGPNIDVLMLAHAKDLPDRALFAIEQFVMRGGHALVFVDPRAEFDPAGQQSGPDGQQDPYASMMAPRFSTLGKLFTAWGVEFDTKQITSDAENALVVGSASGAPTRHLGFIGLKEDSLNRKDVITGSLENINFASPGSFKLTAKSSLKLEPLVQTSEHPGQIAAERFMMLNDPSTLRKDYKPSPGRKVIAGRLTGKITTAFPDGEPAAGANKQPALKESSKPVDVILVADADMLYDMMWVRRQSFLGQSMAQTLASNGDFVMNAVDNLAGSSDLISIRGRASFVRPFTRVDEIKRKAEEKFEAKREELEQELQSTEQKLGELQSSRQDAGTSFILSPEQETELKRFQEEKVRIRKELREVRHGLNEEIEDLGWTIRILNIVTVPLLLTGLALGAVVLRRRRARKQGGQS